VKRRTAVLSALIAAAGALLAAGTVRAQVGPTLGSVNTLPPAAQGNYSASVPDKLVPGTLQLTLQDAIARGLKQNLGALLASEDVRAAHARAGRR